ncbi:MAG: hypothetical protein M3O46_13925 [Myxococcota bacterium]|nr:hypothetical protein [Myxococcota bacterium]
MASTGGGVRREIAWEKFDASALAARGRRTVGATWRERMRQEHLAVGAFALLVRELAEVGCEPVVLALVARASADEVRHTEVCRRFAVALLGSEAVPRRFRGLPRVPRHVTANAPDRALLHVVEMCCLSETLTGVYFTEMLARTTEPVARIAIESLLEDEIDHGRVGWAYLAARSRERTTHALPQALPDMLQRTFDPVFVAASRARASEKDEEKLETHGYLGPHASAGVYARALRDVILPGFERLGVDIKPLRPLVAKWHAPSDRGLAP